MKTILKQIDDALEKLQCLELEITALGIEHVELFEKVKKQEKQLQQLDDEKQGLSTELNTCQEHMSFLEAQLSKWDVTADILAENLVLINENEELKAENETLVIKDHSHDETKTLTDENTKLKEENVRLKEMIANLHKDKQETIENQPKESKPYKKEGKSRKNFIEKSSLDTTNQLYFDFVDN